MISGPVFPRTHAGLLDLVERHTDCIERGLVLLAADLELDAGCAVDAIAKDAAGRPVFVFLVDPQGSECDVAARVLAARAWLAAGMQLLARARAMAGVDWRQPPRMLVLGFDVSSSALQQLAELPAGSVEVSEVRPFRLAGENLVGVHALLGSARAAAEAGAQVPSGISDPAARALAARFIDLLQRLEPALAIEGDRYSRCFHHGDCEVAELFLRDGALRVRVPAAVDGENETLELGSRADCARAVDRIARGFLRRAEAERGTGAIAAGAPLSSDMAPESIAARLSLEPLRRSAASARQLSEEEYSMLGESLEEGG